MTVIVVLSDCPPKLRGDMTKWFIQVNTGVYVGNMNPRIRDGLWQRITENIGHGHATMVFSAQGEQHMDFYVHNAYWNPIDFDGIKLMFRPEVKNNVQPNIAKKSFSKAATNRIIAANQTKLRKSSEWSAFLTDSYIVLDFETTGLSSLQNQIIELAAIYVERGVPTERLQYLIRYEGTLPVEIVHLTGLTDGQLQQDGVQLAVAVQALLEFIEDLPIVCHNARFEQDFFKAACTWCSLHTPGNRFIDTLHMAQLLLPKLDSYKLPQVAAYLDIPYSSAHRALPDCETTNAVYAKLKQLLTIEVSKTEKNGEN